MGFTNLGLKIFKKQSLSTFSLAAALAVSPCLQASEDSGVSLNGMIGYFGFDSDIDADDTTFGGLGVGYDYGKNWAAELDYRMLELEPNGDADNNSSFDTNIISLNGLYHFAQSENVRPYLLAGFGHLNYEEDNGDLESSAMNAGLGLKIAITHALSFRSEYRHIRDLDNEFNHDSIGIGLHYLFGASKKTAQIKPVTPVSPAPKIAATDEDNDGVVDSKDSCLGTAPGIKVDSTGCPPKDSDNDGVFDSQDNCPDSAAGSKVDSVGCYIIISSIKEIELEVSFENNSSTVTESSHTEIENVANFLKQYPLTNVVIEGHTDDRGAAAYNLKLSQSRAEAVAQELIDRYNVDASRVSAKGFGEAQPRDTNDTAEGRARNRRVTAKVSAKVEEIQQ